MLQKKFWKLNYWLSDDFSPQMGEIYLPVLNFALKVPKFFNNARSKSSFFSNLNYELSVGLPESWRTLLAYSAHRDQQLSLFTDQGQLNSKIPVENIEILWKSVVHFTDREALFIRLVAGEDSELFLDDDGLLLFVLDLIQTVPSLTFLQNSADFHVPYARTVIQRLGTFLIYSLIKNLHTFNFIFI